MTEEELRAEGEYLRKSMEAIQRVLQESLNKTAQIIDSKSANIHKVQELTAVINLIPHRCTEHLNTSIRHAILINIGMQDLDKNRTQEKT